MEITGADHAERLLDHFRSGGDISDEELDALSAYLTKDVIVGESTETVGPEAAERGRRLKLALRWHALLDETVKGSPLSALL